MNFCPECGKRLPFQGAGFCPECGSALASTYPPWVVARPPPPPRLCPKCGKELAPTVTQFCPFCAEPLTHAAARHLEAQEWETQEFDGIA